MTATHAIVTPSSPGADSRRATGAPSVTRRSAGYKMVAMLQSGLDLSPIITHRFGIDDFQKGFDAMRSGQSGKVVLDWGVN
jgi:threonine dehydrogenase-like Zn-dependent dehydrogenase